MQSKKIRLLHLIKSTDMGGIEKSTILYSNYLTSKLKFVGIFASKGFYDNNNFISRKVERFIPPFNINNKIYFLKNIFFLSEIIKNNKVTHIHYHHRIFIPFIYFIKLFFPSVKIIYTHHNCFNDILNYFLTAHKIIAVNEATKNDLPKSLLKRVTLITHGIIIKQQIDIKNSVPKNIGYVGRFVEWKGIIDLIQAFKSVNEKVTDTKLILVGKGLLRNEMIKEIQNLRLLNKVIFQTPSISEDEMYFNIDILILPSIKLEGYGIVLLEAMSRGIPVIVSNLKNFKDLVINGYNGLVFKKNLAEKILYLLNNKDKYIEMRRNAVYNIKNKHNVDRVVKEYLEKIYSTN